MAARLTLRRGGWFYRPGLMTYAGFLGWPPGILRGLTPAEITAAAEGRLLSAVPAMLRDDTGANNTPMTRSDLTAYQENGAPRTEDDLP